MSRYDTRVSLRDAIKQRALDLGFDLVGVAPADPGEDLKFTRVWLDLGYAGKMAYLSNPKRIDPRRVLPTVKSVICLGLLYDTPFPYSTEVTETGLRNQESGVRSEGLERKGLESAGNGPQSVEVPPSPTGRGWTRQAGTGEGEGRGPQSSSFDFPVSDSPPPRAWISRYAWGHDYHEIMREKLERLFAAIEELAPGAETRVYVDTGPVNERAFARWSGLGWIGKNTCIINEQKGSWLFLGVILTSLSLEPDLPAPDRCGSCRACLDACPTGALVEPYVMDASRCISYLTIELKGSIPLDLRSGIGTNIFGCDICQDVCPWNGKRRSQETEANHQKSEFEPMELFTPQSKSQDSPRSTHEELEAFTLFEPLIETLASMTEDGFRQAFRHSPIKRAKYRGWLRNLCVAMGNSGDARFISKLKEFAAHPDPVVREHAEWALEQIRHSSS